MYKGAKKWKQNRLKDANTFILKSFDSKLKSATNLYEAEMKTFERLRSDPGVLGFCGNYVQGNTSNVILEYADQDTLDQYFKIVEPPSTGKDIIQFWRQLFGIIKALIAIHKAPWDTPADKSQLSPRHELPLLPPSHANI